MSLNRFVDAAVDKAASAAKMKVKSMLGGGTGSADPKKPSKSGGIDDLFPSRGDSGSKQKGGLFGGLFAGNPGEMNPGEPGGAPSGAPGFAPGGAPGGAPQGAGGGVDFNSAVDELANL